MDIVLKFITVSSNVEIFQNNNELIEFWGSSVNLLAAVLFLVVVKFSEYYFIIHTTLILIVSFNETLIIWM